MKDDMQIPALATRCTGPVDAALVEAAKDGTVDCQIRASCLLAAAWWRRAHARLLTYSDIAAQAAGLVPVVQKDANATTILGALCLLIGQPGELERLPGLSAFVQHISRSKARAHLENVKTYTERAVLAPLEDLEQRAGLHHVERPHHPDGSKVGRNDPCPCGSGKKYKKCCEGKDGGQTARPGRMR
jgi:hypothetical protein